MRYFHVQRSAQRGEEAHLAKLMTSSRIDLQSLLDSALKTFAVDCRANQALHPGTTCWQGGGAVLAGRRHIRPEDELEARRVELRSLTDERDLSGAGESLRARIEAQQARVDRMEREVYGGSPPVSPGAAFDASALAEL